MSRYPSINSLTLLKSFIMKAFFLSSTVLTSLQVPRVSVQLWYRTPGGAAAVYLCVLAGVTVMWRPVQVSEPLFVSASYDHGCRPGNVYGYKMTSPQSPSCDAHVIVLFCEWTIPSATQETWFKEQRDWIFFTWCCRILPVCRTCDERVCRSWCVVHIRSCRAGSARSTFISC